MDPFIAMIVMFAGNFAPRNWALCDGQILQISTNTALFSLVGTIYGGDGRVTFALPDLRGRVAMHPGNGAGLSARRLGEKGGVENVTLTAAQIPSHNHNVQVGVNTAPGEEASPTSIIANHAAAFNEDPTSGQFLGGLTQTTIGGGQSHTNTQPFTCVNFIIALQGTYPSRS